MKLKFSFFTKTTCILSFLLLAFVAHLSLKILTYSDISNYDPSSPPEILRLKTKSKVYLASYADNHDFFTVNQRTLAMSAIKHGIKYIYNYDKNDIDPEFIKKNEKTFENKHGAGLWLWKPYVILKTLESVPENSLIVYADSAFMFIKDLNYLLNLAEKHNLLLVQDTFVEDAVVATHVNKYLLRETDCDFKECRNFPSTLGGFGIFKNTPEVRKFVKRWLQLCERFDLLSGGTENEQQYPEFAGHTYDQSILSIVSYKENIGQYIMPMGEFWRHLMWHHRKTSDDNYQYSLLPNIMKDQKKLRGVQRTFYNSKPMAWIRSKL